MRACCRKVSGLEIRFKQMGHSNRRPAPPHSYLRCRLRVERVLYGRPHRGHGCRRGEDGDDGSAPASLSTAPEEGPGITGDRVMDGGRAGTPGRTGKCGAEVREGKGYEGMDCGCGCGERQALEDREKGTTTRVECGVKRRRPTSQRTRIRLLLRGARRPPTRPPPLPARPQRSGRERGGGDGVGGDGDRPCAGGAGGARWAPLPPRQAGEGPRPPSSSLASRRVSGAGVPGGGAAGTPPRWVRERGNGGVVGGAARGTWGTPEGAGRSGSPRRWRCKGRARSSWMRRKLLEVLGRVRGRSAGTETTAPLEQQEAGEKKKGEKRRIVTI
ncbi:translation initiation factor IF-2-like [Ischnura elegans]|uniref:translation initiation factor IF-2-like n=1 Tax=Ischnura elegans TaxID=197161 RepID=UPI001ED88D15|nr:translation initiation factor IF-2-like [Ischnura elegans]